MHKKKKFHNLRIFCTIFHFKDIADKKTRDLFFWETFPISFFLFDTKTVNVKSTNYNFKMLVCIQIEIKPANFLLDTFSSRENKTRNTILLAMLFTFFPKLEIDFLHKLICLLFSILVNDNWFKYRRSHKSNSDRKFLFFLSILTQFFMLYLDLLLTIPTKFMWDATKSWKYESFKISSNWN